MDMQPLQVKRSVPPIPKIAFNLGEAEYSLGVSKRTLNRLIETGQIQSVRIRGCRLIPAAELFRIAGARQEDADKTGEPQPHRLCGSE
jgi:excisionase family DNA binding protein